MSHPFSGARRIGPSLARMRTDTGRAAADWNARMLAQAADGTRRGTRWGRGAFALVPSALAVGVLGTALAQGALAANFSVTGQPFTLTSNGVRGSGFGAIVNTPAVGRPDGTTSTSTAMARVGFASAGLAGLCGIVHQTIAGVPYSLLLTGGQKVTAAPPATFTTDIDASNLYIQATELQAYGPTTLQNAVLGQSADQVTVAGKPLTGALPGGFGLGSAGGEGGSSIALHGLNASAYDAEMAGALVLPDLKLRVVAGTATAC
ncbi:DUF6230 family protein [Streptomyces sp. NK15101]|uniref:DUF6230 family protein n=1 Tax=Streptomyces sp. NK15101 TaxID=2873261 RepID=UPI001CEC993A|nr:DUF6230 family protein [Streptomyces sp. NK15101]